MKKMYLHLLWLAIVGGFLCPLPAQSLERTVIGSAGGYQASPEVGNLHWTVGEIAVEVLDNDDVLSQGFHQAYFDLVSTPVWTASEGKFTIAVFPNPASGWVQLTTDIPDAFDLVITDLLGRPLLHRTGVQSGDQLTLQHLPAGIYLLRVSREGRALSCFKVQKINR